MRKNITLLLLLLAVITSISSCKLVTFSENNSPGNKSPLNSRTEPVSNDTMLLTPDMVKEKYKTEKLGQIVRTYDYKNYLLVKYIDENSRQGFDLYNLETGDRDILPTGAEAEIFRFASGDSIELISNGFNQYSGWKDFPYYMAFTRPEEITGNTNDFHMDKRRLYKKINEEEEFGVKRDGMLHDLKVTLTGFEMEFTHQPGKEAEYYAGNVTVQAMKTSYESNKNQLIVELIDTIVSPEMLKKKIEDQNRYITSIEIKEKGSNSLVIVNLKGISKYYNAELEQDQFPRAKFFFEETIGF